MKERMSNAGAPEAVISIIGPGMKIVGDCITDGTVRVEGVVEGNVRAGKAVVIGKEGTVDGSIETQDAVIAGTVKGTITAASRLELQSSCHIEGEVLARRMQLEEGAILNGKVKMGDVKAKMPKAADTSGSSSSRKDEPTTHAKRPQQQPAPAGV